MIPAESLPPTNDLLAMALRSFGFKPRDVKTLVERTDGKTLDERIRHALALARTVIKVAADATRRTPREALEEWAAAWLERHPQTSAPEEPPT